MAVTDLNPTVLALNTASADLADADGTAPTTAADGIQIYLAAAQRNAIGGARNLSGNQLLIKIFEVGSTTDTVVIVAGDNPPASRAGLGNLSISLAADDVKYLVVEASRFVQWDSTNGREYILVTMGNTTTELRAFLLPKAG